LTIFSSELSAKRLEMLKNISPRISRVAALWDPTTGTAMARHGILKGTRGPLGGYELAREQRRITADEILRATDTADKTDRTPVPQ
jgi:hypothetical protein